MEPDVNDCPECRASFIMPSALAYHVRLMRPEVYRDWIVGQGPRFAGSGVQAQIDAVPVEDMGDRGLSPPLYAGVRLPGLEAGDAGEDVVR